MKRWLTIEEIERLLEPAMEELKSCGSSDMAANPFTRWTFVDPETNLPTVLWPGKPDDCEESST
jgi:hypothetical protein